MEINMDMIGYVLYGGLGLSVLSFLLLLLALFSKNEPGPIFDQAMNDEYEEDDIYDTEEFEAEDDNRKKSLFNFRKNNKTTKEVNDYEIYEDDDYEVFEEEIEDEYKNDFEIPPTGRDGVIKRNVITNNVDLSRYDFEEDKDDFEPLEIKKYEDDKFENPHNRMEDNEINEEEEMMKRIQNYKNKFQK